MSKLAILMVGYCTAKLGTLREKAFRIVGILLAHHRFDIVEPMIFKLSNVTQINIYKQLDIVYLRAG